MKTVHLHNFGYGTGDDLHGTDRRDGRLWLIGWGKGQEFRAPNESVNAGLNAIWLAWQNPNTPEPMACLYPLNGEKPAHALAMQISRAKNWLASICDEGIEDELAGIKFSENTGMICYTPQKIKSRILFRF